MSRNTISLSQACEGMIRYKQASGKNDHTITDYRVAFKKRFLYFPSFFSYEQEIVRTL